MNTRHTRDLDPNFYINANGEFTPIPIEEFATREPVKKETTKSSKIVFNEKLHPRDKAGIFIKNPFGKKKKSSPKILPRDPKNTKDIRNKIDGVGDKGFQDILIGLAAGAINEVMDVTGDLPRITLEQTDLSHEEGLHGLFDIKSKKIKVDSKLEGGALTAIHEIGHFLDHNMGKGEFRFDAYMLVALKKSKTITKITQASKRPDLSQEQKEFASYFLSPKEVFARAFTQYIVSRSSNSTLKRELKKENAEYGYYWEDKDFEPIGKEMDRIFKTKKRK